MALSVAVISVIIASLLRYSTSCPVILDISSTTECINIATGTHLISLSCTVSSDAFNSAITLRYNGGYIPYGSSETITCYNQTNTANCNTNITKTHQANISVNLMTSSSYNVTCQYYVYSKCNIIEHKDFKYKDCDILPSTTCQTNSTTLTETVTITITTTSIRTLTTTVTNTPSQTECHNINRTIVEPNPASDCDCSDSQVKSTHSSTTSITNSSNINLSTVNSTVSDENEIVNRTKAELQGIAIGLGALGFGILGCIIICTILIIKKRQKTKNRINATNLSFEVKE